MLPIAEVIEKFDLPQVNRSNAHFDLNKLFWINGEYMRAASLETLLNLVRAGYGVTVVPALALAGRERLAGVEIRPLVGAPVRELRLAYRRNAPRRAALDLLAEVFRREIRAAPLLAFTG